MNVPARSTSCAIQHFWRVLSIDGERCLFHVMYVVYDSAIGRLRLGDKWREWQADLDHCLPLTKEEKAMLPAVCPPAGARR